MNTAEALALFKRHKCTCNSMSFVTLSKMVLSDRSRLLATEMPTRKGAYVGGDVSAGHCQCKIVYYQSKKPVYTPSGWAAHGAGDVIIQRSSCVPESRLVLEFVYGYDGICNTSANVFYNCQRQVRSNCCGEAQKSLPPKRTSRIVLHATCTQFQSECWWFKLHCQYIMCPSKGGVRLVASAIIPSFKRLHSSAWHGWGIAHQTQHHTCHIVFLCRPCITQQAWL
jgi:hypothetical protein